MTEFTGLATRLRALYETHPIIMEAADEIERLQSALGKSAAYVLALGAKVEAHKRSRQIDANEARSREMELRAEVERLRAALQRVSDFDPDGTRPCEIAREALRASSPTTGSRDV